MSKVKTAKIMQVAKEKGFDRKTRLYLYILIKMSGQGPLDVLSVNRIKETVFKDDRPQFIKSHNTLIKEGFLQVQGNVALLPIMDERCLHKFQAVQKPVQPFSEQTAQKIWSEQSMSSGRTCSEPVGLKDLLDIYRRQEKEIE